MSLIQYAVDDRGIVTITFDRDAKRNAVNREMADQLLQGLERAEAAGSRLVILRANPGVSVWCAGHDLGELDPNNLHHENATLRVARKIRSTPLPVMAMVEGHVYAAGLILLLSTDLVIATNKSDVAITSNKLGLPLSPDLYAHWLHVVGLHKTKELLFTARSLSAEDAYHAGLYNHAVPPEDLEPMTLALADQILACSPEAVSNTKYQLNLIARQTAISDEELKHIDERNSALLASRDTKDRIAARLAALRRKDNPE